MQTVEKKFKSFKSIAIDEEAVKKDPQKLRLLEREKNAKRYNSMVGRCRMTRKDFEDKVSEEYKINSSKYYETDKHDAHGANPSSISQLDQGTADDEP